MSQILYRGKIIDPVAPFKCNIFEDGGLLAENDEVKEIGEFKKLRDKYKEAEVDDLRGSSMEYVREFDFENKGLEKWLKDAFIPPFFDHHLHWVQNKVKGSFCGELLPWLKNHIWPEEEKFSDKKYAEEALEEFFEELISVGTRGGFIYSSVHRKATEMALEKAKDYGDFVVGNVLMDQNSPEGLQISREEEVEMVEYFAKKYGERYAITPRFAPTCSMELMKKVGKIAQQYGCYIQTHLSENKDEIKWVKELFPKCKTYTEVYEKAGLLGPRTVLGHCIHLKDKEWKILKKYDCVVAHCPTSNLALGSGRMPVEKLIEHDIRFGLGTDIGAGPKLNMLDVMEKYIAMHNEAGVEISFEEALFRATVRVV